MKSHFIGLCAFVLVGLACQAVANPEGIEPPPNSTGLPDVTPQAAALFQDDFSNTLSNWKTGDDGEARLAIEDGAFHIQINIGQNLYWTTAGLDFSDVRIEVDTEKLAGPDSAEFGLICRYDETNGIYNFYYLVIAGDNYAAIIKVVNGEQVELSTRGLAFDAIRGGSASNHIVAECVGNQLSLYANGIELFRVTDDSHTGGDVGLIASTYEEGGIDIRFDNFVVTAP
jgi:hypothetical protein